MKTQHNSHLSNIRWLTVGHCRCRRCTTRESTFTACFSPLFALFLVEIVLDVWNNGSWTRAGKEKQLFDPQIELFLCAQIDQGYRTEATPSLVPVFPTAMVVKEKDAESKLNKASEAHTGRNKRKKKQTSTTTPKKVRLYSSSLQLLFQQKICNSESDRAAGKPDTPCDWATCSYVTERGLIRSSPTVLQFILSFLSFFFFPVFSVVSSIL